MARGCGPRGGAHTARCRNVKFQSTLPTTGPSIRAGTAIVPINVTQGRKGEQICTHVPAPATELAATMAPTMARKAASLNFLNAMIELNKPVVRVLSAVQRCQWWWTTKRQRLCAKVGSTILKCSSVAPCLIHQLQQLGFSNAVGVICVYSDT